MICHFPNIGMIYLSSVSRSLQLNAVPECLASIGLRGTLFLGIRGDLYVIKCETFLPHTYQQMVTRQLVLCLKDTGLFLRKYLSALFFIVQVDYTDSAEPVPESTEQNRKRK